MNDRSAQTHLEYGMRLASEGKLRDAEQLLQRALQIDPDRIEILVALFQLLQQLGDQAQALEYLLRATTLDPRLLDGGSHLNMARALVAMGRVPEAHECVKRAIALESTSVPAHEMMAELYLCQGAIPDALRCYQRILKIRPELGVLNNKVHLYQSLPYKIGRIENILFELKESLAEHHVPVFVDLDAGAESLYRGRELAQVGRLGDAISQLTQSCELSPTLPESHFTLGLVSLALHSVNGEPRALETACSAFRKLCALQTADKNAWYQRGIALLRRGPAYSEDGVSAIVCFDKALELDPLFEQAHYAKGSFLVATGEFLQATEHLKQYVLLHEKRLEAHPLGKLGIRFLPADATQNIGHVAHMIKVVMKEELLGWRPRHSWVCLAPYWFTGNLYFLEMWKDHCSIVTDSEHIRQLLPLRRLFAPKEVFSLLPGQRVFLPRHAIPEIEAQWEREKRGPILMLPDADKKRGWEAMEKMGIPGDAWFVTFHIRDVAFKGEGKGSAVDRLRGSNPRSYVAAIKAIADRGGWVVRTGEPSQQPLDPMPQFVQYSHSEFKNEWMDIFLFSQCHFLLCGPSGVSCIPPVFHKPVAMADAGVCVFQERSTDIFIPKLFRAPDGRLLTFRELAEPPFAHREAAEAFVERGIEFVDCAPEDIYELTTEMLGRIDGTRTYTPEEEERQARYHALYHPCYGGNLTRIGSAFLKKYAHLL